MFLFSLLLFSCEDVGLVVSAESMFQSKRTCQDGRFSMDVGRSSLLQRNRGMPPMRDLCVSGASGLGSMP